MYVAGKQNIFFLVTLTILFTNVPPSVSSKLFGVDKLVEDGLLGLAPSPHRNVRQRRAIDSDKDEGYDEPDADYDDGDITTLPSVTIGGRIADPSVAELPAAEPKFDFAKNDKDMKATTSDLKNLTLLEDCCKRCPKDHCLINGIRHEINSTIKIHFIIKDRCVVEKCLQPNMTEPPRPVIEPAIECCVRNGEIYPRNDPACTTEPHLGIPTEPHLAIQTEPTGEPTLPVSEIPDVTLPPTGTAPPKAGATERATVSAIPTGPIERSGIMTVPASVAPEVTTPPADTAPTEAELTVTANASIIFSGPTEQPSEQTVSVPSVRGTPPPSGTLPPVEGSTENYTTSAGFTGSTEHASEPTIPVSEAPEASSPPTDTGPTEAELSVTANASISFSGPTEQPSEQTVSVPSVQGTPPPSGTLPPVEGSTEMDTTSVAFTGPTEYPSEPTIPVSAAPEVSSPPIDTAPTEGELTVTANASISFYGVPARPSEQTFSIPGARGTPPPGRTLPPVWRFKKVDTTSGPAEHHWDLITHPVLYSLTEQTEAAPPDDDLVVLPTEEPKLHTGPSDPCPTRKKESTPKPLGPPPLYEACTWDTMASVQVKTLLKDPYRCLHVRCNHTVYGPLIDVTVIHEARGCCEVKGQMVPSGTMQVTSSGAKKQCSFGRWHRINYDRAINMTKETALQFKNKTYHFYPQETSIEDALELCHKMNGTLALPQNLYEELDLGDIGAEVSGFQASFFVNGAAVQTNFAKEDKKGDLVKYISYPQHINSSMKMQYGPQSSAYLIKSQYFDLRSTSVPICERGGRAESVEEYFNNLVSVGRLSQQGVAEEAALAAAHATDPHIHMFRRWRLPPIPNRFNKPGYRNLGREVGRWGRIHHMMDDMVNGRTAPGPSLPPPLKEDYFEQRRRK